MEAVLIFKMDKIKIPKIYINKKDKNGEIILIEFPKGVQGKRMWDRILLSTKKRDLKINKMNKPKGLCHDVKTLLKGGRI